jgi:hypothetical protein
MSTQRIASLTAMAAFAVVLAAASMAQAQMMAPPMQPPMQPSANVPPELITNNPQADPGDDPAHWSPRQNVVESRQYEQLLKTNPAFRQARIRKECGPINEPDLYQQCVATFQ